MQARVPAFPAYRVIGEPEDLLDAQKLASEDRYQFLVLGVIADTGKAFGRPHGRANGKKSSDNGIYGIKVFVDDNSGKAMRMIVQVKSGHVKSGDIRDRVGALDHKDTWSRRLRYFRVDLTERQSLSSHRGA